ncbi:MAG: Uncharacterized protein Athens101426_586 [Parcubacteria group bacterium Athens1014_26]|nr:MAG: Uncharacterized protein Athens101426_586 [Parcubacteria group bacterium Athens1014_26]
MIVKKYIKFISLILIAVGIIWGGIYLWKTMNTPGSILNPQINKQPDITDLSSKLKMVFDDKIFDYWINSKTNTIYYLGDSGQISKISASDTSQKGEIVNSQNINQLNKVMPSPDGAMAVAEFNYPKLPTFSIFDTATNAWQPLPPNIIAVAWSPDSKKLAYLENKDNTGRIAIYDIASKKTQEVIKMTQKDLGLSWVKNDEMLFYETPSANIATSLYSLNTTNKTIKPLIKDEYGLTVNWSLDGKFGIKLINTNRVPSSVLIDASGNELASLSSLLLPPKCQILERAKIYCGIPKTIPGGIALPDDYYKNAVYFQDELYLIDLASGKASVIFNNRDNVLIDASRLTVNNSQLLFINRYDGKLYSLDLK